MQKLRRIDRTARKDHIAPRANGHRRAPFLRIANADRALAIKDNRFRQCALDQLQIGPRQGGAEIGIGRAPTPATTHHLLIEKRAFLIAGIVIGRARQAERLIGRDIGFREFMRVALIFDGKGAVIATHGGIATAIAAGLGALEIGQHIIPGPAAAAKLRPHIVIGGLAAHIKMAIDGTRPTQNLAAWERDFAIINVGTGRGFITPIQLRIIDGLVEAGGDFDENVIVLAARFQNGDAILARSGQPISEHATGGTGANNHIVEFFHGPIPSTFW